MDSPLDQSVRTPAAGPAASGHASGAAALIRQHLAREDSAWSMGGFGALGEFLRAAGEPVERLSGDMGIVSARGALRLAPPPEARAIAHETPSADPRLWNHAIEFCLPQERAAIRADHAGARLRAWTRSIPWARINRANAIAFFPITQGFLVVSGKR